MTDLLVEEGRGKDNPRFAFVARYSQAWRFPKSK